jgi:pyruvate dehydrogenase E2 component (dihydrolipoamide acetyltransferase)
MAFEFKLPDIGEGLTEGEVVKWLVAEGDAVESDQPMVEVMTDKATVEITSPRKGVIAKILAKDGQTVPVGSVMVVIEEAGGASGAQAAPLKAAPAPAKVAPAAAPPPASAAHARAPAPARAPATAAAAPPPPASPPPSAVPARTRTLAAPATRKRARVLGIDLNVVGGSGPNGRVTREDLENHIAAGASAAAHAPVPAAPALRPVALPTLESDQRVPLRGLRGKIAEQMVRSKQFSPHFTYVDECDMTEVVALRAQAKEAAAERGAKLTYLPFVIKALTASLKRFPSLNAHVDDAAKEYVLRKDIHVGIATDTEDGLTVPVVKGADRRSIVDLAAEIQRLTEAARAKKIAVEDLKGSTITITSAGSIGGFLATPILNYPEVAILGVYKISERAVVRDGQVVVRHMMNLSITLDHRIVDGATSARFLNDLIGRLEKPGLLLLDA